MKIAILTPTFSHFSGIDRVVALQAEQLKKEGHEVKILCLKAEMKSKHAKIMQLGLPKNPFFERIQRLFFFFWRKKIEKGIEAIKDCDVAIAHFYPMTLIAAKAKNNYGVKFVFHNHGVATPELFESFAERSYMKLFNFFTNKSIKNCDAAVSISKYLQKVLKKETGIDSEVEYDRVDKKR
ncbi:MAG: glycosyltransferase family 4 protein, partial [Candidatus Woesearchaeota archaeon]